MSQARESLYKKNENKAFAYWKNELVIDNLMGNKFKTGSGRVCMF